jgi:hypothetical protein
MKAWIVLGARAALLSVLLVLVLAGCGSSSASTKVGATSVVVTPLATNVVMQVYHGSAFQMSYPESWKQSASGNQVTFADIVSKNLLTIVTVANPNGELEAKDLADQTLPLIEKTLLSDGQPASVAATVKVGGLIWEQRSATGGLAITDPGVQGTLMMLVTNYPAAASSTQAYEIFYYGPSSTFTQAVDQDFQPMLQSLTFS